MEMSIDELRRLLGDERWVALATVDVDRPRVRMMTIRHHDGQFWCFTSASSAKAGQLRRNGGFELVAHMAGEQNVSSLRAAGRADIVDDPSVKQELAASSPGFKKHWQSSEDPDFMLLRLTVESIEIERGPETKAEKFSLG